MRTAGLLVLILLAAAFPAAPGAEAAAPNSLIGPLVSPTSGSTTTVFTFSVRYRSKAGYPALSVTASVAGLTVPLALASGTTLDGTYTGTSTLPAGTWMVDFAAAADQGGNPTATAGPVQVTGPPNPTPAPTAPPPPPPPPPPVTPPPAAPSTTPAAPVVSASPVVASASPAAIAPGTGGGADPPGSGAGSSPGGDDAAWAVLLGLGVAGAVGVWWIFLGRRRRRAQGVARPADGPAEPMVSPTAARAMQPARQPASWEVASALEEEPIGTVDYVAEDGNSADLPPNVHAALASPSPPVDRGNPRVRRMAEMHSWRDGDDRRTLLHRIGLPDGDD